jgi:hypothetical protein
MLFYPGGTSTDHDAEGYSLLGNFFSDLGMVRTYSGDAKTLSLALFASALALMGVAFVLFFAVMPGSFNGTRLEWIASRLGSVAGVLAGVCCVGIAATPWDVYEGAHMVFSVSLAASFLVAVLCYLVAMLKKKDYPGPCRAVFAGYLCILTVFLYLVIAGPGAETGRGLVMLAIGQKIVIYAGVLSWVAQFAGALAYQRGRATQVSDARESDRPASGSPGVLGREWCLSRKPVNPRAAWRAPAAREPAESGDDRADPIHKRII